MESLEKHDPDEIERLSGNISIRIKRVEHIVTTEMENYESALVECRRLNQRLYELGDKYTSENMCIHKNVCVFFLLLPFMLPRVLQRKMPC